MRLVVFGATGRTGSEIVAEASERGHDVAGVATAEATVEGVAVSSAAEFPDLLDDADAAVDFTAPDATREFVDSVVAAGVPYVVGTTGFDAGGLTDLRAASESVPVLKATNFARGVQALLAAVTAGVGALPGYDVEVTETHHAGKRDAPSGTAETVLDVVESERESTESDRVHGREGRHRREDSEIGVHVRRAGNVRGEHEVLVADNDEVLTLTHRAESRRVFAAGAVDAAEYLAERPPGWYDFADVL